MHLNGLGPANITRPVCAIKREHPDGIDHLAEYRLYEIKPDGSRSYLETVGSRADYAERARQRWESILNCTFRYSTRRERGFA